MSRNDRQSKILELVSSKKIETQEDLTRRLVLCGVPATQATVSRDIKELGLIKAADQDGVYYYAIKPGLDTASSRRVSLFKSSVISLASAENMLVIKTIEGAAGPAAAFIDSLNESAILGSVAGDDTIFAVAVNKIEAERVAARLKDFMR